MSNNSTTEVVTAQINIAIAFGIARAALREIERWDKQSLQTFIEFDPIEEDNNPIPESHRLGLDEQFLAITNKLNAVFTPLDSRLKYAFAAVGPLSEILDWKTDVLFGDDGLVHGWHWVDKSIRHVANWVGNSMECGYALEPNPISLLEIDAARTRLALEESQLLRDAGPYVEPPDVEEPDLMLRWRPKTYVRSIIEDPNLLGIQKRNMLFKHWQAQNKTRSMILDLWNSMPDHLKEYYGSTKDLENETSVTKAVKSLEKYQKGLSE